MKILITGGGGFIGSHLVHELKKDSHEIAIFDNYSSFIDKPKYFKTCLDVRKKYLNISDTKIFKSNILDYEALEKAFKEFKPEVVVHLAGLPMARPLEKFADQMNPINMQGTLNVLKVFEATASCRKIIYTSSSMSYGHFNQDPQTEEVILKPINAYGACKAAGEYFVKLSKKEWVIVRPTSVYGFTDGANRVTQLLLDAALSGKAAWVVRGETLDFSYVKDVAIGFAKCVNQNSVDYQTINLSRGVPRSAVEFAEVIKKHFPKFSYDVKEPTVQQVFRGALDISRARNLIGFDPKYNIEDGIKETLELVEQFDWVRLAY